MKTIYRNGTYERVSDEVAERAVKDGTANYAPKEKWKKTVRDLKTKKEELVQELSLEAAKKREKKENKKSKKNK